MKKCGLWGLVSIFLFLIFSGSLAAKEPIKIGAFFALSGPAAFIGTPTKLVAEMAVAEINKKGGINGRPLELVIGDTEGDPSKAVAIAKRFIYKDKVVAIIGPTRTGTGMAVKPIVEAARVPTIMTVGGDPVIMGGKFGSYRYVFKTPQRSSTAVRKIYQYLKKKGLTRIAILTATDGFGKDGRKWLKKLAPEYGLTIVAEEAFNPRDTDMTAQLAKVWKENPQALVAWTIGPAGAIVAKNVKQLGITAPLFQCHGLPDPKYIELAGPASEGNLMPSTKLMAWEQLPDTDPQKPVIAHFVHLYKEVYHYDRRFPINTHSGYAWDAIMILARALEKVGPDREKLREAIENTKGYVGISGVYNITPEDHNGLDESSMIIVKIVKGHWVLEDY
ncbi:ABC transporter substrate-binding protein [Thermosulfurimonas dismutans]|uniref:High-affinity leucine-specific transport system, periplasmic binding protein LivK n=1 Tax=Thermosulfurimonas dismutans TaxID=999894 RepID=A0A179D4W3_9BACT|nr:ABC transporter substrate-binding protein [Thermosulfurimonas dismutans]OAQ20502.1 High-affinity leucine-specific transport system, periplasmic binding protein LivK [Thermosulfurimonas dismutans]